MRHRIAAATLVLCGCNQPDQSNSENPPQPRSSQTPPQPTASESPQPRAEPERVVEPSDSFSTHCPDPAWLERSAPTGSSHAELQAIFRQRYGGEQREDLPSVGFMSMKRYSDRPEVVLYGLMLVAQRKEYPALERCSDSFFSRYFSFRSSGVPVFSFEPDTAPDDTSYHVAGAVGNVASALLEEGNPQAAARLLDRLFRVRGNDLPADVAQASGYDFADALAKSGQRRRAMRVLRDLIERFDSLEEGQLTALLNTFERQERGIDTDAEEQARNVQARSVSEAPMPRPDRDSPTGTRLIGVSISSETIQSVAIDLDYELLETGVGGPERYRASCTIVGHEVHSGFQPGGCSPGRGTARVNVSVVSGPQTFDSDQLRCWIDEIPYGAIAERTFPFEKRWTRRSRAWSGSAWHRPATVTVKPDTVGP